MQHQEMNSNSSNMAVGVVACDGDSSKSPVITKSASSFVNKRKFGLTINLDNNSESDKVDSTNIFIVDSPLHKDESTSPSPNNTHGGRSPPVNLSLSPNSYSLVNNNVNVKSLSLKLKINTKLLSKSANSIGSAGSSSDEPLESSRWLGCDADKIKIYDPVCSKVCDYLFMGSETIASDYELLRRNGITHIINASLQCKNYFEDHPDHPFIYKKFPLRDIATEDIGAVFPQVIEFIENARAQNGKVFIHCQMGVSRSPCLCMLWIMHSSQCSFDDANDTVRAIRPISRPNVGFQLCLMNWAIKEGLQEPNSFRSSTTTSSSSLSSSCSSPLLSPLNSPKLSAFANLAIHSPHSPLGGSPTQSHFGTSHPPPSPPPKICKLLPNNNNNNNNSNTNNSSNSTPTSPSCAPTIPFSQNSNTSIPLSTANLIVDQ